MQNRYQFHTNHLKLIITHTLTIQREVGYLWIATQNVEKRQLCDIIVEAIKG